jgi:hypothetical protein
MYPVLTLALHGSVAKSIASRLDEDMHQHQQSSIQSNTRSEKPDAANLHEPHSISTSNNIKENRLENINSS